MPAFEALDDYNPLLVLILGVATFGGIFGVGLWCLRPLRLRIPSPVAEVVGALLGISLLSLAVQLLGIFGLAGSSAMLGVWGTFVLAGTAVLLVRTKGLEHRTSVHATRAEIVLIAMGVVAAAMNLVLAMAPSTKIDEIYYQMIVSARMALDDALVFHLQPWPAAVLPQMGYGIATAPLHSMGVPDAPNVLSWCLGVLLAWFASRLVFEETQDRILSLLAAVAVVVGLYPSIYHTTGGPHALSDLATASGLVVLAFQRRLLESCTSGAYVATLSICCMVAASTKVSLGPLMGAALILGFVRTVSAAPGQWPRLACIAVLPWVVFYLPLCVFTFWKSGSPFGPMFADLLAPSVYGDAVQAEMEGSRTRGDEGLLYALEGYVIHYPAIFAVATLGALLLPSDDRTRRPILGALFLLQVGVVAALLPHYARYLAGLHHALLIVGLIQISPWVARWSRSFLAVVAASAILLLPWFGVQLYRSYYLGPVALGIGDTEDYYRSYIALYHDILKLDAILPDDAVLYTRENLPSIYFPRPVFMHPRDLPRGRPAFAILGSTKRSVEEIDCSYMRLPDDCRFGEAVYVNPEARYKVFRTPGRQAETSRIEVREILEPRGTRTSRAPSRDGETR